MIKNSHNRILKRKPKKQHLSLTLKKIRYTYAVFAKRKMIELQATIL